MPVSEGFVKIYNADAANDVDHQFDTKIMPFSFTSGTTAVQYERVTIAASGFTALTVPASAKGVVILLATTGSSTLTLKGVTGDTGILTDGANAVPLVIPLRGTPSIGFAKSDAGTVVAEVWWL